MSRPVYDSEGNDHRHCSPGWCTVVQNSSILCPMSGPTGHDCNYA